jgi:thiol:disulfide interchange protein
LPRAATSLGGLAALMMTLSACQGPHGPPVGVPTLADLPQPLPTPYDESATSEAVDARIDAALASAKADDKRVLIDLGGNWCSWCRMLDAVMSLGTVKPWLDANYEVVPVDVASADFKIDRNLKVLARFGVARVDGLPWVLIVDPDGHVLASSDAITDDAHHTPQAMVDWLATWARRPA